jgi:hypothetical protein
LKSSKTLSSINSGHRELILILLIFVLSKIYFKSSANLDGVLYPPSLQRRCVGGGFVDLSHHADRLIQVRTTSFHQLFSKSIISFNISSFFLEKCFHLFFTVKQYVQKLSHHHWIKTNFLV